MRRSMTTRALAFVAYISTRQVARMKRFFSPSRSKHLDENCAIKHWWENYLCQSPRHAWYLKWFHLNIHMPEQRTKQKIAVILISKINARYRSVPEVASEINDVTILGSACETKIRLSFKYHWNHVFLSEIVLFSSNIEQFLRLFVLSSFIKVRIPNFEFGDLLWRVRFSIFPWHFRGQYNRPKNFLQWNTTV